MSSLLEAREISKTYGKNDNAFTALDGVSIQIAKGDIVAITGKSGSGKSTLMHLLALLDTPTGGTIRLNDEDLAKKSRKQVNRLRNKSLGFIFQQFFLNANDSVLNNVILPLKIAGVGVKERKQRGLEVLKAVELSDKASGKAGNLSGGQKQRVCIARALINDPEIIFADEPTGNLDSATGKKIEDLIFKLNQDKGITLIFVTHDPDLARRCKRVIQLKDGKVMRRMV